MRNIRFIESLIPIALKQLTSVGIATGLNLPKSYNGYMSSFGASVVQAGLKQSVLFFSCEDENKAKGDRRKITELIFEVLKEARQIEEDCSSLKDYVEGRQDQTRAKKEMVLDGVCACKMAMRTFHLE